MENYIIIAIILLIIGGIVYYLLKAKKRGQKCIGCPYCKECSGKCGDNKPKS
jgi:hypothetical protein